MAGFKFRLEDIRKLPPQEGIYARWDGQVPGLGVRVYPSGKRVYVLRLRFRDADTGGKRERLHTVGPVQDFETVEDARKAALELRRRYRQGEDVKRTERRQEVEETTLEEWMDLWLEDRNEAGKHKPSTAKDVRRAAKEGWHGWTGKPIQEITPEALLKRHAERSKTAKARANLEARYLRAVWRWVAARNPAMALGPAPTALLNERKDWNTIRRKERRVEMAELPAWFEAVRALSNKRAGLLFELLAYSGLRSGEARALRWQDVDMARATVHLPDPKNKRAVTLPLSKQAVAVLKRLKKEDGESPLLFPILNRKGEEVAMGNPSVAIRTVADATGRKWSPHDLRRGFLSIGAALRIHPVLLRRLTNHAAETGAHEGYFTPELEELREAAQAIGDRIEAKLKGGKVVKLPRRRRQ